MSLPRHLERFTWSPRREIDVDQWPYDIPAIRQVIAEGGFEVPPGITVLVGENGSGKSTLVEAFAAAYPRRGAESTSSIPVTGPAPSPEDSPLRHRFTDRGVYFLDEPESALSFQSSLALLVVLDVLRQEGSQAIVATHSPLISALPGATTIELGPWGMRPAVWEELELVESWRDFLTAPQRWLRQLLDE